MPVSSEDAKAVGYVVGIIGAVGIGAYAVSKLLNPGAVGGACNDPKSPCGSALAPYQQEFQTCLNQYTALLTQIAQGGQPPTASQQAALNGYLQCTDDAAANMAKVAQQYEPTQFLSDIGLAVEGAIFVAALYYGIKGLGSAIKDYRNSGRISTNPRSPSGVAACDVIANSTVLLSVETGMITAEVATAWQASVNGYTNANAGEAASFYNTLATEAIISSTEAAASITALNATMGADGAAVDSTLSSLGGFGYFGYPVEMVEPNVAVDQDCGCY